MNYEINYFENLVKLIKYLDIESIKDSIDKSKKINEYLNSLSIDKRKIAVGMDFMIWYFDVFSKDSHFWNVNPAYFYAANTHEFGFLTAKPKTSLMTLPAFNTGLANLMQKRSKLTLLNNYQLNLFEKFIKTDDWNYDTVTMQQIEHDDSPTYDFICMSLHDVVHRPELTIKFFDTLNTSGTLMMLYTGMDSLYQDQSIYTDIYEVHDTLKNIKNSVVYHNPTGAAVTYAVKL
jgi:hypothetical protein